MNWLGEIIQKHVMYNWSVLDLGCGIMQATTDSMTPTQRHGGRLAKHLHTGYKAPDVLRCKSLLGCELVDKYLDVAKKYYPVIKFDLRDPNAFNIFVNKSFDVVICLDVVEHLEYQTAIRVIGAMERIARKKIIIYTPSKFESNCEHVEESWGLGENEHQEHKCWIAPERFRSWGYKVSFPEPDKNTLAIKVIK